MRRNDKEMSIKKLLPVFLLIPFCFGTLFAQQHLSSGITISYHIIKDRRISYPWDEGYKIYQQARRYIYRKDWPRAIETLNELITNYPKSNYIDASYYWLGYCNNKLNMKEEAFKNLQYLVTNFPHSPWSDDAQMLMVGIAEELIQNGELEYSFHLINNINRQMTNVNVRLMTLNSLLNLKKAMLKQEKNFKEHERIMKETITEHERAIQERERAFRQLEITLHAFDELFKPGASWIIVKSQRPIVPNAAEPDVSSKPGAPDELSKPEAMQFVNEIVRESLSEGFIESTAFILNTHLKKKSFPVLVNIALKDPNPMLRGNAVLLISEVGGEESFEPLVRIYEETKEPLIKMNVVISFGRNPTTKSVKKLVDIAKNEENENIREQAIFWVARQGSDDSIKALANIYEVQNRPELKMRIINFIGQKRNNTAKKLLTKIAKKEKNEKIKEYANFWIKRFEQ
jgi:tetratricopeptide (TPR) repeat protein